MPKTLYAVYRDEGHEVDLFDDAELAEEWANHIGSCAIEEPVIDRGTLDAMKESYGPPEAEDDA